MHVRLIHLLTKTGRFRRFDYRQGQDSDHPGYRAHPTSSTRTGGLFTGSVKLTTYNLTVLRLSNNEGIYTSSPLYVYDFLAFAGTTTPVTHPIK
jgi:hypothetical protein